MKPGRYIGREWNCSGKDFDKADCRFALCFPDLYEVGMSNLGLRIIYSLLNGIDWVYCDRVFSVGQDLELSLQKNNRELFALESGKGLKEFDFIGFSVGYELSYTNILHILKLAGLPFESSLRGKEYPLVIGGGPCTVNPEPLTDFFDLFIIGEAEEVLPQLLEVYRRYKPDFKSARISKEGLLAKFSAIEGVYVPCLYAVSYTGEGKIESFRSRLEGTTGRIQKRFLKEFNLSNLPASWLVPYIEIVHDRLAIEVMRGCPNSCRFCQARQIYYPFRQRNHERVLELADKMYCATGYDEISLVGLSVSDYKGLDTLCRDLVNNFRDKAVAISLPSIKPQVLLGDVSSRIAMIKKTGLTFAPEAGTQRLRQALGKTFDTEVFFAALEKAYASGYQHVKLYFMIGLPQESRQDLDAIIELSSQVSELSRKISGRPAQVNISINTLIPKPHTAFQWLAMEGLDSIKEKQDYLKAKAARNKRLKLSFHDRFMSFIEAVLSRGDRRLSCVIKSAYEKGCRFDAWSDHFKFDNWLSAFQSCGLDPEIYLKERPFEEILPWDFIHMGLPKEILIPEARALKG